MNEDQTVIAVQLGEVAAKLEERDKKLDAIHISLKEDLGRIETQVTRTNGRVTGHDKKLAELRGGFIAFGAASPFFVAFLAYGLVRIFS